MTAPAKETRSILVKFRTVRITVYPWRHSSGREYWRFKHGGKAVTHATVEKATTAAKKIVEETFFGTSSLGDLTPAQSSAIRRMLAADPSCALVDEFLLWHSRRAPRKNCQEAVKEFLAIKKANAGLSKLNVTTLSRCLAKLPAADLCDIHPATLQPALSGAARTRRNTLAAWTTFFRWCVRQGYLPHGEATAPERIDKPLLRRGVPATYTPAELATLFLHVRPQYLPWLALAAYAGLRTEEVIPQHGSQKSPLDWSDIHWDRDVIIVRPETAKTGSRRVVPILPALRSILHPIKQTAGRIGPQTHPSKPSTHKAKAETTRLGGFIGGWKRNALRHSWISFRVAHVGYIQTSTEAGNSETETRRSYNDAKSKPEADAWFAVKMPP